jgi:hypothetical protein
MTAGYTWEEIRAQLVKFAAYKQIFLTKSSRVCSY